MEPWSHWPIAPVDLHLGHVLEFGSSLEDCRRYAWVAAVDNWRMVPCESAMEAVEAARVAVGTWHASEVSEVEAAWRERIAAAQRFCESS